MKKLIILLLIFFCIKVNASIVVMDAESGRVLYSEDKDKKMLIASTTKIMTSIIALENANINRIYTVSNEIDEVYGSMIYIKKNEKISLETLLYGLLLRSGNDAAMTIANNVMNYNDFISSMNIKANLLNMKNTVFNNPHGLDEKTQNYSTAYDMSLLMKYAIKNKTFMKISGTKIYSNDKYKWYNKNELLNNYKYATSGKIGYTTSSGQVFVSSAKKDNKELIITTIKENDKFNLHKNLYEKYFNLYKKHKILNKDTFSFKIKEGTSHYYIKNDFNMLLKDNEIDDISIKIDIDLLLVKIYLKNELIHVERIYELKNNTKSNFLNKLLSFFKN